MRATVVTCRDPFRPSNHRSVDVVRRRRSLRNLAPRTRCPVICQLNGKWISRKAWALRVKDGDSVVFVSLPQGGGGGGGGSNPLRIVLTLAVMVMAPYLAAQIGSIGGIALTQTVAGVTSLTMAGSIAAGVIGMVGSMLINAVIPAPKATQAQQAASLASPSPTYSLGAQGNSARIGQPIPVIYGRHQVFPDFAAMPYVEYAGNEQYLYQLFCIGQGEYDIEAIRIEDTPISSFGEVTYEIVPPGSNVTLFPTAVTTSVEVSGQEALTNTVLGPFVANAPETLANYLAIDVVMSRGLYYANDSGGLSAVGVSWTVEAQKINDLGVADGAWFTLGTESYSAATTTPQRLSYKYEVASGRYQVRMTRTDTKQTGSRYGHELDWAGLRAYMPGTQNYGNVTMCAMRLRATNNLSQQASRKINFIVTRKLKTWNPETGWSASAVATRSIAWALADICRAEYGTGLPDARIDLQGLYELDAVWSARGDTLNGVFDSQSTIMEALTQGSRAGRSIPFIQGGIVHVVRDAPASIPVALFSQRNIVKNSFKIEYLMASEETADAVDVTYFDEEIWGERTVHCTLPGGTSEKPASVKLFGVTNRQQAWREGMYVAACNRYRRRIPTFSTEMEGFIPTLCDLIAVQHDMPKWGQSGEVVSWNPVTKQAILSEPLDWSAGGAHVLAFRRRDGSPAGPYAAVAGTDAYRVTLSDWSSDTDPTPDTGGDRERSHYAFGPANQQYIRCRMVAMRPKSSETVEIAAVVESDFVHTADTGTAPGVTAWQLPSKFTAPVVTNLSARAMPDDISTMLLSWTPAAGADHYLVEQSADGEKWTRCADVASSSYIGRAIYSSKTLIRVAGVGLTVGPWVALNYGDSVGFNRVGDVQNVVSFYRNNSTVIAWDSVVDQWKRIDYEIRKGAAFATAQVLGRQPGTEFITDGDGTYWVAAHADQMYSSNPASIVVAGSTLIKNVIATIDEQATGWSGDVADGALLLEDSIVLAGTGMFSDIPLVSAEPSIVFYGGVASSGIYTPPEAHEVDVGSVQPCNCSVSYLSRADNPFSLFSKVPVVSEMATVVGNYSGLGDVKVQIATSGADGVYGTWRDFVPGAYVGRKFKFRALLNSYDPTVIAALDGFSFTVDMPDRLEKGTSVSVPIGGLSVTYATPFQVAPNVQITIQSASQNDDVLLTAQTKNGFTAQITNSGSSVARTINWLAQGY